MARAALENRRQSTPQELRAASSVLGFVPRWVRLRALLKLSDLSGMGVGLLLAVATAEDGLSGFLAPRLSLLGCAVAGVLLGGWHLCFRAAGLYRRQPLLGPARLADAAKACVAGLALFAAVGLLLESEAVEAGILARFGAAALGAVCALRLALGWARGRASGDALRLRRVLIAGSGPRALRIAEQLERDCDAAVQIVGFADDDWPGLEELRRAGRPVVCALKELGGYLRGQVVDEVLVALPMDVLHRQRRELIDACREQGVTVRFPLSALVDVAASCAEPGAGRDEVVVSLYHGARGGWSLLAKRAFDLALGIPLALAALPVCALAALGITLSSPGPVFFTQERVGFNKRRFRIYKFRTMVTDAEARQAALEHLNETSGPTFKLSHDPRVTPIGRLLRAASIDELPQLINVLRGEMSLVGPRPLPLRDFERFEEDWHRRRFSVLPGLTGLWQVSGRSSLPFARWIELDLQYIDQWSLLLDLRILIRTIPAVLCRHGAK